MTLANALTLARILCAPLVFGLGWLQLWWLALAVYLLGLITDAADGWHARATQTTTPFGRAMDSAADKALVASALVILAAAHRLSVWFVFLFVLREFVVFGLRAIRTSTGTTVAEIADRLGRARFTVLHFGLIVLLTPIDAPHPTVVGVTAVAISTTMAYATLGYYVIRDAPALRATMKRVNYE